MTSSPRRRPAARSRRLAVLTTTCAAGAVLTATPAGAAYLVDAGDTVSGIARRHGVTVQSIAELNALSDADVIHAGQELAIPGRDAVPGRTHVVAEGETLSSIAARHGLSVRALAEANGLADPDLVISGTPLALVGATASEGTPDGGASGGVATVAPSSTSSAVPSGGASNPAVRAQVGALIRDAAARYGWRPQVPLALAMNESGWNNSVVSDRGAVGIMQVLPATADWVSQYLLHRPIDLHDPADNVEAGMAYLDWLYRNLGRDVELALAAYYEGYGRVSAAGRPSAGAQHYVDVVLSLVDDF